MRPFTPTGMGRLPRLAVGVRPQRRQGVGQRDATRSGTLDVANGAAGWLGFREAAKYRRFMQAAVNATRGASGTVGKAKLDGTNVHNSIFLLNKSLNTVD